jgi:hypothetical protein
MSSFINPATVLPMSSFINPAGLMNEDIGSTVAG